MSGTGSGRDVEHTPDGRYVVIDGRRWRATDPDLPQERREELQKALMAWRRDVRRTRGTDEEARSRAGVQPRRWRWGSVGRPGGSRATTSAGRAGRPGCRCRVRSRKARVGTGAGTAPPPAPPTRGTA